MNGSFGMQQD